MKRLYTIILILLLTGCGGGQSIQQNARQLPTIPPEWLTKPPTPEITRDSVRQQTEKNIRPPKITSPEPTSVLELDTSEVLADPTSTPLIRLPKLLGRLWTISADPGVPEEIINEAQALAAERPDDFLWVEPGSVPTDLTLKINGQEPIGHWLYVAAAPFATIEDDTSEAELEELWSSTVPADRRMLLTQNVSAYLREIWGEPGVNIGVESSEELVDELWAQRPSLTILPFEEVTPDLKVLRINGETPFDPAFSLDDYPLRTAVGVGGKPEAIDVFLEAWKGQNSNFDLNKLTTVAMTGVTALVRATATQMEIDGITSPAADVGPVLRAVDFAHISNEVSFTPDCPEPNPIGGTSFCSQDEYFELLTEIGTDIIELTGNHLNDWGAEYVGRTIDMYETAGMDYFGGGRDAQDAQRAAIIDHNGNRIALVGCNYFGPVYAWATETTAGSRECTSGFYDQIAQLKAEGYVVIATQQYTEYYQYPPMPDQERDFKAIVDAGASAVSGSQGHHAQGFAFHNGAFIHYGLGNLFFDQMDMMGTRQSFVDIYNIYDGRLINVDLWTGLIENYSTPRKMTTAERQDTLKTVFEASGW
jgi:hypothetical protein